MKKSLFFKLLCVFSFVFGIFSASTAFSDYIIDKTTYDENGTLPNQATSVNDNGEKVTITLKYLYYDRVDSAWENVPGHTDIDMGSGTDSSKYDALYDFFSNNVNSNLLEKKYDAGLVGKAYSVPKGSYGPFDGKNKYVNYSFLLYVSSDIKVKNVNVGFLKYKWHYYGHYTLQVKKHEFVKNGEANDKTLSCNKGVSISSIKNDAKLVAKTGYTFTGIRDVENGAYLSDDVSITTNKELFLCFYKQADVLLDKKISSLTNTINNTTGTLECWKGNSDYTKDISADPSYNQIDNKVCLGTSSLTTTVQAKAKIRFNMNNGKEKTEFKDMTVDTSNKNFEPEDGQHERQYTVALANDLIVNGAFTIGGNFGNTQNGARQGHLYKEYVCLDLNGHDIYVNSGGGLWFYGLVKDSVGTGHIYVNGGTIYTLATIMDYRGGGFTSSATNANVFPFIYYGLPYLRTTVVFNYTNSGWGKLVAFCRVTVQTTLDIGNLSHSEFELNFIGSDDTFLFKLKNGEVGKSRFIFDGYKINNVSSNMCIQQRVGIIVENAYLSMNKFAFTIASVYKVDTMKYNFPINPFFDIRLVNSTIVFCQRIQFMAGMSFIADKDSTVIFTTSGEYSAQLSILDKGANYYDNKVGKLITTDNSGETYSYEGNIQNNVDFWKYYSQPKIKIYGKLLFTKGNTSSKKYKLMGPCDFNEENVGTIDGSNNITMYDKTKYSDPFTFLNQNGVSIQTYGFDYQISYDAYHVRGFSRPLVSNGKAYAVNDKDVKIGTYSFNEGVFRMADDTCYYFFNDNDSFKIGDTAGNEMRQCTVTNNIIDDNGTKYIYFASMYGQYDSASSTVNLKRISNNATAVKVSYSRDAERWLRS